MFPSMQRRYGTTDCRGRNLHGAGIRGSGPRVWRPGVGRDRLNIRHAPRVRACPAINAPAEFITVPQCAHTGNVQTGTTRASAGTTGARCRAPNIRTPRTSPPRCTSGRLLAVTHAHATLAPGTQTAGAVLVAVADWPPVPPLPPVATVASGGMVADSHRRSRRETPRIGTRANCTAWPACGPWSLHSGFAANPWTGKTRARTERAITTA